MNKLTYFPGCSAHGSSGEFENSLKLVIKAFDTELEEIPDWNCCGATSAHVMTEDLAVALPMRNLILAEKLHNKVMTVPCASCFSRMKATKIELDKNPELKQKINQVIPDGQYQGTVDIKSGLQYFFEDVGIEKIKEKVVRPLTGLKVACYYGCLLTRPKGVAQFDSPEYPVSMDKIMEALGATVVPFDFKTECCGASFSISDTEIVYSLTGKILENAHDAGADLVAVACPLCQSNLDMRQHGAEKTYKEKFNLPVLYFTQLIALALGIPEKDLQFGKHIIAVEPLLHNKLKAEEVKA